MTNSPLEQALALHQSGNFAGAEEAYLSLVGEEPENAEALKLLGVLSCQMQKLDEGVSYLEAAIEIEDSISEYHLVLGHAYLSMGKIEEGILALKKAAEIDPGRAEVHSALGDTYQQVQQFAHAFESYQKAVAIDPGNILYRTNAGLTAVFSNHFDVAAEYLERVVAEDDSISSAYYGLCLLRGQAGDVQAAGQYISTALALEPDNPEYLRVKAELED